MFQSGGRQIQCPNCHQPIAVQIEQVIDGGRDSQAKARLLSGRLNVAVCPNCGYEFRITAPLVYHDGGKELLLINIPMELGLPQAEQERIVGSMTRAIVDSLPQEQRKGYLLTPRNTLTMQGMIDTILEADGITREMVEARRAKLRLAEQFLQTDPEQWPTMAQEHDAEIDEEFFTLLVASAQGAAANGRADIADQLMLLREALLQSTTVGQALLGEVEQQEQMIQEVSQDLTTLGDDVRRENFVDLAVRYAALDDADERLQVLVGLVRPALDYQFFQVFAERIEQAADDDERAMLTDVRDHLLQLTEAVDAHTQNTLQASANVLQTILDAPDIPAAIRASANQIDDTFMAILTSNIQNAEQTGNLILAGRLKEVFDVVMNMLQENAPPPIRFINDMMRQPNIEDARAMLVQRAHEFGQELLDVMDVLLEQLGERGENPTVARLRELRRSAEQVLSGTPDGNAGGSPASEEPKQSPIIIPFSARRRKRDE